MPNTKTIEEMAEEHVNAQGLSYRMSEDYQQMVASQIRAAFIAGAQSQSSRIKELERMIESLTPGGSEFVGDPQRCIDYTKEVAAGIPKLIQPLKSRIKELEEALEKIQGMKLQGRETDYKFAFNRCWHIATDVLNKKT